MIHDVDRTIDLMSDRVSGYGRPRAVVALSGGVDSSVVVAVAARALGPDRVLAVTALSPSYPAGELDDARAVASALAVAHRTIDTGEVEREAYARNDDLRCYHCKMELYTALSRIASGHEGADAVVLAGANGDDAEDLRPGLLAARQRGIRNPLLELGVRKEQVRAIARRFSLPVAEKPAMACLSSRVAFGVRVTPDLLGRIDRGEQAVRALGFDTVRIRHFGERAVIEVDPRDVERLRAHAGLAGLIDRLRTMGWREVAVDRQGYRQGSMNATLSDPARVVSLTLEGLPSQAIEG
jgi:pyridinium-3,5-biscarboxylic acid mononucleotide sulfurtransferase